MNTDIHICVYMCAYTHIYMVFPKISESMLFYNKKLILKTLNTHVSYKISISFMIIIKIIDIKIVSAFHLGLERWLNG